ncbi:S41 family peptidase [Nonomuraea sp. NPDC059023]|uniref:S41 family peptidase n=1 Tax=unclassified Nonomuraea TaxID=2593643 RepID=UPI0036AB93B4
MSAKTVAAGLVLLLTAACAGQTPPRALPGKASATGSPACAEPPRGTPPAAETPTTVDVIEQAYLCILSAYYGGPMLDPRTLLNAGFVAFTQELNRSGHDLAEATMPAMSGDRAADWAAFEKLYRRLTDLLPQDAKLRERLAAATLEAIVAALDDNHARWVHGVKRAPSAYDDEQYGLGFRANLGSQTGGNPGTALPPLFVTSVLGGAAKRAGLRPGDIIESVNGSAPFAGNAVTPAAITALYPRYPQAGPVRLRVLRQDTGRRREVTLKPGLFRPDPAAMRAVTAGRLGGDIAHVRLRGFGPDSADRVLKAISRLNTARGLAGLVLDLRGNGGGSPDEVNRLLGAFAHGKVTAYQCAADGACDTMRTDDGVALLGLPFVVLTDRACASACEHFSAAVKDHGLGKLVGTRTAGAVSGPAQPYLLSNNTMLSFPSKHHRAPNREVIDRVGVAPDHYVPATPEDVAAGRDAALAKALTLLPGGRAS